MNRTPNPDTRPIHDFSAQDLIDRLKEIASTLHGDQEAAHGEADKALLKYIGNRRIKEAWDAIEKWYA